MRNVRPVSIGLLLVLVTAVALGVTVVRHGGYRLYVVHTGSMMPTYNPGDVVVDRPAASVHQGEVITFRHSALTTDVVTHRVVSVRNGRIHTKGDANRSADVWVIPLSQVRGVVTSKIPHLGYALVFLHQPAGIGSVMTAVVAVSMLWGLFFPSRRPETARG